MTDKQERFVGEYMLDLNATQAAIRAGYSAKTAGAEASRLLTNVNVLGEIKERQAELAKASGWTERRIIDGIASIASDAETKPLERLRAYELLGKHLGMWKEKVGLSLEMPRIIDDWAQSKEEYEDGQ